ncbi:short-chain dehydrogenase [Chitinophagaceae bacterium LWZ2-11]
MNIEEIEKFLSKQDLKEGQQVKIDFKKRDTIYGLFVKGNDYSDLTSKNFWRIVTLTNMGAWEQTKNINLSKIFSGSEFSRLTVKAAV